MRYRVLVILAVLAVTFATVAAFLPPREDPGQPGQPPAAEWERRAWAQTLCDRCGKPLTANPQDGLYLVGGKPYWLHEACAKRITRVSRR